MGSMTSRPKVPAVSSPQIVYMPAPAASATSVNDTSGSAITQSSTGVSGSNNQSFDKAENSPKEASETVREKNLLSRQRGRLSTVLTGFRGVLSNTVPNSSSRKNLLGE